MDMGWDPAGFLRRCDTRYFIKNRETDRYHSFGSLMRGRWPQQEFLRIVMKRLKRGGGAKFVVLKSRKIGISTACAVLYYDIVTHLPNTGCGILAHTADSTKFLFQMAHDLHYRVPHEVRPNARVTDGRLRFGARLRDEKEMGDFGLGSFYEAATAGGLYSFAGATLRLLLESEAAKWPGDVSRQTDALTSANNAVSQDGASMITMESTANGDEGLFRNIFKESWNKKKITNLDWTPIFLPFQSDSGNVYIPDHDEDVDWSNWPIEDREKEEFLRKQFKLTDHQLLFRRSKILNNGGDPDKFDEDFPYDVSVAFLSSGRGAIPGRLCNAMSKYIDNNPMVYSTRLVEHDREIFGSDAVTGW